MQVAGGLPTDTDPMIDEIVAYWRSLNHASVLPDRQEIDPTQFPRHLSGISLLDVERNPWRFRFRLLGDDLVDHHSANLTGRWMDDVFPHFPGTRTELDLIATAESQAPVYRRGKPLMTYEKSFVEIERIMLPFRNGGAEIGLILIFSIFR